MNDVYRTATTPNEPQIIETLLKYIIELAEDIYQIENVVPELLSVSSIPLTSGQFQSFLVFSKNVKSNAAAYLNYPDWYHNYRVRDPQKQDSDEELYGEGITLIESLEDLKNHLTDIKHYKSKSKKEIFVVKDSDGKYFKFNTNALHWTVKQKDADRFSSYEEAKKMSDHMNKQLSQSKVIKLKCCDSEV